MTDAPALPDPRLPKRDPRGHKGSFGSVAVVGGCATGDTRMIGAPALAALGALRAGAGLARLVCPEPVLLAAMAIAPSTTGRALPVGAGGIVPHRAAVVLDEVIADCDALAIGPGLGTDPGAQSLSLRAVQQEEVPVVVDADGLNCLAGVPELPLDFRARAIVTPHPGEFRRLADALRIRSDPTTERERPAGAEALAQRLGCIVVLKGAGTVVSDGQRTWVCSRGHACLATAGTGDVLTGVILGLVAQFVRRTDPVMAKLPTHVRAAVGEKADPGLDLFDAARAGVLVHALAGERWAQSRGASAGLLATELVDLVPAWVESIRED